MADKNGFQAIFLRLKSLFNPFASNLVVVTDSDTTFYADTPFTQKNKKPMFFGSVMVNKGYVAFHLMPVYCFPELLKDISPELKKRMQGKSCFNFKC